MEASKLLTGTRSVNPVVLFLDNVPLVSGIRKDRGVLLEPNSANGVFVLGYEAGKEAFMSLEEEQRHEELENKKKKLEARMNKIQDKLKEKGWDIGSYFDGFARWMEEKPAIFKNRAKELDWIEEGLSIFERLVSILEDQVKEGKQPQ
jgi:succinate dehydrogenase/fumarate reductase flavoprotein subunit